MSAPQLQIRGGDSTIKLRSPVNSAIFDAITLGIYGFYWYYQVNKELAELGRARGTEELGTNPTTSFLALMPGIFVVAPFLVSGFNTGERVRAGQRLAGVPETISSIAGIVLMVVFFPAGIFYVQRALNEVWRAETHGAAAAAAAA